MALDDKELTVEEEQDEEIGECKKSFCVNNTGFFLWYKAFYMFFIGAFWMKIVYLPLYFKQIGLPAHYVGVLSGIAPFLRGAGSFFFGLLGQKPATRKMFMLISLVAQTLTPLLCLIPRPEPASPTFLTENPLDFDSSRFVNRSTVFPDKDQGEMAVIQNCSQNTIGCFQDQVFNKAITFNSSSLTLNLTQVINAMNGPSALSNKTAGSGSEIHIKLDVMSTFWINLIIITIGEFLGGPARSLADTATLQALGKDKKRFGYIRSWGNIGQLLITGIIYLELRYEHVTVHGVKQANYKFAIYATAVWMALSFPTALGFVCDHRDDSVWDGEENGVDAGNDNSVELSDVLFSFQSLTILIIIFCVGVLNGTFNIFMFWFVMDIARSKANLIITVALVVRIVHMIITFQVSGPVIHTFGVTNVIHFSLVVYCGTYVLYGFMRNPWLAIIPEAVQSVAMALTEVGAILFFGEITPPKWTATVQGIVQCLLNGLGFGIGPIIGGFLVTSYGIQSTFMVFAALAAGVTIFSLWAHAIHWFMPRTKSDDKPLMYKPLSDTDDWSS